MIQGRERPTRWGKTHCLKNDIATLLAERGYSIYPTLCQSAEQSCEYFSECKYIRQFSAEYDVRIFSHAYLALDRGFLDSDLPDYAVIDETFYSTLIAGVGVNAKPTPLSGIKTSVLPTELKKALELAPTNKPLLAYLRSELGEDELISTIDDALNERHQAILSVLRGWAKHDAAGALAWVQQLPPGRLRNEAPGAIASLIAEKDPEAAFELMKGVKSERGFGYSSFYSAFDTWAGNDPAAAAAKAAEIKNAQQRQNAYQNIARRWAEKDVPAALAWAKSLPDGRDRNSALDAVLSAWSATDPKSAAAAVLELPAGQTRSSAVSSLMSQWGQSDLTARPQIN